MRLELGFDGGIVWDLARMLRLLLLGSIVLLLGVSFRNGWVEVHWDRVLRDSNLPFLAEPEPARRFKFQAP